MSTIREIAELDLRRNMAKLPAPPPVYKAVPRPVALAVEDSLPSNYLEEYAEVAAQVGVTPPELAVENFKILLRKLDLPVYALDAVVAYMDDKAAKESKDQAGWEWQLLREKDFVRQGFGRAAERGGMWATFSRVDASGLVEERAETPASDYYPGLTFNDNPPRLYSNLVPLHALKRIAMIEKEFTGAHFMVSDYLLAKHVPHPDPFLMAVIPNARLNKGVGRFVIDFWDEPGFGIKEMLK